MLHYLYVLDEGTDFAGAAFTEIGQDVVNYHELEIATLLDGLVAGARAIGANATPHVAQGAPAFDVILAQALTLHADLIVMATHGRRGLSRTVIGSVTEDVLRQSTIPVLVLHQT
jgi:nucleotide-binding universal stress UspA family protein